MKKLACCLPFLAKGSDGGAIVEAESMRKVESKPLIPAPRTKLGPIELQEKLDEIKELNISVVRHVGENFDGEDVGVSPKSKDFNSRVLTNYLDAMAADHSNEYTLVIKGPLKNSVAEDALIAILDSVEGMVLDDTDSKRFKLCGIKVCDLEIKFPLTSFINNLLTSGKVRSFTLSSCSVSPPMLATGLHITWSTTLTYVAIKSCALGDAHLNSLIQQLKEHPQLCAKLASLHLTGSYKDPAILDEFFNLLEDDCPGLRSLSFPKRHENLIKKHSLCTVLPNLFLNGRKVRNVIK
eukprot:TRINITY_DN3002_c0_g1_i1.p1 TRINITY_DN3002_c0_g1~~TRINITY_DN3002_c0_g1_i1.p1  ORF type:complete len:318 (+),score=53.29 TRINITY_DN3002_c0_g1_i1:71-955(+)